MKRSTLLAAAVVAVTGPTIAHAEYRADTRAASEIRPSRKVMSAPGRTNAAKQERSVADRIAISTTPETEILSVDAVLKKINTTYMAGLQRCYRKQLAVDPSIGGKVTLLFSVDVKGNVLSDLHGLNDKLDTCISRTVGMWRFPHADEPAEATFKIGLVLSK